MKRSVFAIFQQELQNLTMFDGLALPNFRRMGEFAVSIEHSEAKSVSASVPLTPPTRGSALGPRWGLRSQTPVIGSRSARSPWPPFLPNPKYATAYTRNNY